MSRYIVGFVGCLILLPFVVLAQVRGSTNYTIISDSLNAGGGLGTSSSYILESTIGEQATGYSTSTSYTLDAGYQQWDDSFLALSSGANVALPNLSGITGGTSQGTTAWNVTTNNPAGYTMTIEATSTPALRASSGASFDDYTPAGSDPDFMFSVGAGETVFAFSPEGSDIVSRFKDNGTICGTGSSDASERCFDGLSTTPTPIAGASGRNDPSGATTTVRFIAGIGSAIFQESGAYEATVIITAISL